MLEFAAVANDSIVEFAAVQTDADFVANVKLALSLLWHVENVRHSRLAVKPVACSCSRLHDAAGFAPR